MGPLPLLLGGACPLLRTRARRQCLRQYIVCVGSARHPNWVADEGGGGGGAGYLVIIWMGPYSAVPEFFLLRSSPRRRRARRKRGSGASEMKSSLRSHEMAYMLLQGL